MSSLRTLDHYVTVRDGSRVGFLVGPFDSRVEALKRLDNARDRAIAGNSRAWFMAFGTSSLPMGTPCRTVFALDTTTQD